MNIFLHVSLCSYARVFLGYLPENRITRSKVVSSSSLLDFVQLLCKSTDVHFVGWILTAGRFIRRMMCTKCVDMGDTGSN